MANGYGQLSGDGGTKKRKVAIIGVSSLILVAMVVAVTVGVGGGHKKGGGSSANNSGGDTIKAESKSIKEFCKPTDYRTTCVDTLQAAGAGNTSDPRELMNSVFKVATKYLSDAMKKSDTIKHLAEDPRSKQALENCRELMNYAIDDLNNSMSRFKDFDLSKLDDLIADLKVWLSATVTYQETCLDGFSNSTSEAGKSMKKALEVSDKITRNTLALADSAGEFLNDLQIPGLSRRLLSDGFEVHMLDKSGVPSWVSDTKRKLLQADVSSVQPNVVVAKDGSGKYKTITAALRHVPKNNKETFVIYIKEGVYAEHLIVDKGMDNVMFLGDGPLKTKITGKKNFIDGTATFKTATVAVVGSNFIAKDIGFENSAGPEKHQAVALRVQSDMSIFYNCQMDGYQDTLYTHTHRQFYRDCTISGTIDFIFGDAAVVFQNCTMVIRKPLDNQQNIVTAQGRKDKRQPTGTILQGCKITADPALVPVQTKNPSYLGRPWKEFSRTIIMQTEIGDVIHTDGWLPWMGDFALNTCFYAEVDNKGPGSSKAQRVKWRGIKNIDTAHAAQKFTARKFIQGDIWVPQTGVPYESGMLPK